MTGPLAYVPIDAAAKDGQHHLVRDNRLHLWSACYRNGSWFCGHSPIRSEVIEYMARPA